MARTANQIMRELSAFFDPSAEIIKQERKAIKPKTERRIREAERLRDIELGEITKRARQRGILYSGLPIEEEGRLFGRFEDTVGDIRDEGAALGSTLGRELASLRREQGLLAQQLRQSDLDREEARRQARQAAADAQANLDAINNLFAQDTGMGDAPTDSNKKKVIDAGAKFGFKNDKDGSQGFFFQNSSGRPISAFEYARLKGVSFFDLLKDMSESGDKFAGAALRSARGPGFTQEQKRKFAALFQSPNRQVGSGIGSLAGTAVLGGL